MPLIGQSDLSVPVVVQARSRVAPPRAFDIVVPIDLSRIFTRWGPFPGVRGVRDQGGPWDAVGRTRTPLLTDGSTADERITELTAPSSFAYEITGFTNILGRLVHGVRGEWTFTPDGGGTVLRWTYEFHPRPGRHVLVAAIIAPLWRRAMGAAMGRTVRVIDEASGPT